MVLEQGRGLAMHWIDGAVSAEGLRPFDLADRGLLLGDGVFDTALVLHGAMVWREAHVARLRHGCRALGFSLDEEFVGQAIDALAPGARRGALRITVTRGGGPRGLAPPPQAVPRVFAAVVPIPAPSFAPLSLHVSAIRRNQTSPVARLKALGYLDAILAAKAAAKGGFDDALFLNTVERVACSTTGNIVALCDGTLLTPPLGDGVLAGTARAALQKLAPALGLKAVEASLSLDALLRAEAVYVTNSLRLLAPVTRIGAQAMPNAAVWTERLKTALCEAVRADSGHDPREEA